MGDDILKKYNNAGVVRGGITLLPCQTAVAFVNELKSLNKKILGIDGFVLSDCGTVPHMEHSMDCSTAEDGVMAALEFLENRKDLKLFFEVVYRD